MLRASVPWSGSVIIRPPMLLVFQNPLKNRGLDGILGIFGHGLKEEGPVDPKGKRQGQRLVP